MKIEILHTRDPDGGCAHTVFVDGERVPYADVRVEDVDAGRGYTRATWDEHSALIAQIGYSEGFTAAVLAERADPPGGQYIEED